MLAGTKSAQNTDGGRIGTLLLEIFECHKNQIEARTVSRQVEKRTEKVISLCIPCARLRTNRLIRAQGGGHRAISI